MNEETIKFIEEVEGRKLDIYLDSAGLPTVGVGHLIIPSDPEHRMKVGDQITEQRCEQLLSHDLIHVEESVNHTIRVSLNNNQRTAIESFVFNVGAKAFAHSHLCTLLNLGDYDGAANEFAKWKIAGGVVNRGLVNRRIKEEGMFRKPVEEPAPDEVSSS